VYKQFYYYDIKKCNYLSDEKSPLNQFKQIKPRATMYTLAFVLKLTKIKDDAVEEYVFGIHVGMSAVERDCCIRRVDYFVVREFLLSSVCCYCLSAGRREEKETGHGNGWLDGNAGGNRGCSSVTADPTGRHDVPNCTGRCRGGCKQMINFFFVLKT